MITFTKRYRHTPNDQNRYYREEKIDSIELPIKRELPKVPPFYDYPWKWYKHPLEAYMKRVAVRTIFAEIGFITVVIWLAMIIF